MENFVLPIFLEIKAMVTLELTDLIIYLFNNSKNYQLFFIFISDRCWLYSKVLYIKKDMLYITLVWVKKGVLYDSVILVGLNPFTVICCLFVKLKPKTKKPTKNYDIIFLKYYGLNLILLWFKFNYFWVWQGN